MLRTVLVAVLTVSVSACGLVFGGTRQNIRLDASPTASIKTQPVTSDYTTPASISLERSKNYTVTFAATGYQPKTLEVQRSIRGGIVVLDIICGLVPVIIDAATGAWYKLTPEVSSVTLQSSDGLAPPIIIGITHGSSGRWQFTSDSPVAVHLSVQ